MYEPILKKGIRKYNPNKDYCTLSPEKLLGCLFNKACYWHDRQYRNEVVNRQSRFMADLYLWGGIIKECWKVRKTSIFWSWRVGLVYYIGVRLGGRFSWRKGM